MRYVSALLALGALTVMTGCSTGGGTSRAEVIAALEVEGFVVTWPVEGSGDGATCIERERRANLISIMEFESVAARRASLTSEDLATIDVTIPLVFWADGPVLASASIRPEEDGALEEALTGILGGARGRVEPQFQDRDQLRFSDCASLLAARSS